MLSEEMKERRLRIQKEAEYLNEIEHLHMKLNGIRGHGDLSSIQFAGQGVTKLYNSENKEVMRSIKKASIAIINDEIEKVKGEISKLYENARFSK